MQRFHSIRLKLTLTLILNVNYTKPGFVRKIITDLLLANFAYDVGKLPRITAVHKLLQWHQYKYWEDEI